MNNKEGTAGLIVNEQGDKAGWHSPCPDHNRKIKSQLLEMIRLMLIAGVGGFLGTCLRFLAGRYMHHIAPAAAFPWGTFAVNVAGSLLIGILYGLADKHHLLSPATSALLITGFCGGLTTFSSFADDLWVLLAERHQVLFVIYLVMSFALGLTMVMLGRAVVKG